MCTYTHTYMYQQVIKVSFSENFAYVPNQWSRIIKRNKHVGHLLEIINKDKYKYIITTHSNWNSCDKRITQRAITCSKLTIERPEQGVKYVQS